MFVRRRKNKSGKTSVVVVDKSSGKFKDLATIGATEVVRKAEASLWTSQRSGWNQAFLTEL